jgi:hypothetical protein
VVPNGTYSLGNHRNGGAAPPLYGLRLDRLIGGDTNHIFTFDFEGDAGDTNDDGAAMFITIDLDLGDLTNSSINIIGTVYFGRDADFFVGLHRCSQR